MGLFGIFRRKERTDAAGASAAITELVFPNGQADLERDAREVMRLFHGKLDFDECKRFVAGGKTLIVIAQDKSAEQIVPSLMLRANDKVSEDEAYRAFLYLSGGGARCSGGDGLTREAPVVVTAENSMAGVQAEYQYVEQRYGEQDVDWTLEYQSVQEGDGGTHLDILAIKLKDGQALSLFFDISSFYGKF